MGRALMRPFDNTNWAGRPGWRDVQPWSARPSLAADQRHADAQNNLGVMYGTGAGVPQDYVQAHMWFNLSAARVFVEELRDQGRTWREQTEARMTPEQIAEAQRLAREWDAAHPREPH